MSSPLLVDAHVHLAPSTVVGQWSKDSYQVWEYGAKPDVQYGPDAGTPADLRGAMRAAGIGHAVVVNAFSIDEWRDRWLAGLGDGLEPVESLLDPAVPPLGSALVRFNEWLVDTAAPVPEITPFVAVDPWLLPFRQLAEHLDDMCRRGARGIKIHPVEQRFLPADPRMARIYRLCVDRGLAVVAHSGTSRGGVQFAEPRAFLDLARAGPDLRLVLAHLGGGSWRQTRELADGNPRLAFDLSEVIAWTGAPHAPTSAELVRLVRDIGVERVLFGSDFPWYDPGATVRAVRALPGLTTAECAAILGENAARILSLPV
jgi:predicted TIM-barrel fold metal-dependent hydrolase